MQQKKIILQSGFLLSNPQDSKRDFSLLSISLSKKNKTTDISQATKQIAIAITFDVRVDPVFYVKYGVISEFIKFPNLF